MSQKFRVRAYAKSGETISLAEKHELPNATEAQSLARSLWSTGQFVSVRATIETDTRMDAGNVRERVTSILLTLGQDGPL